MKLEMGQKVKVRGIMVRLHQGDGIMDWVPNSFGPNDDDFVWGWWIGTRTVHRGFTKRDYEDGNTFFSLGHKEVNLVAVDSRKKPIYVRDEDIVV